MTSVVSSDKNSEFKKWLRYKIEYMNRQILCEKCHVERVGTLFLPCRHVVCCEDCSNMLDSCITCNTAILGTARVKLYGVM